jgi:hypothetical protein
LSNKSGVSAIKNSFFLVAFSFVLIFDECYRGQPVGAGWTAYFAGIEIQAKMF